MRCDASNAECHVYTFKDGFLSAIAHDLRIRVTEFEVDVDPGAKRVHGRFDPRSLRVDCAMRDGSPAPSLLGPDDRAKIERTITTDVLPPQRVPHIEFHAHHPAFPVARGGWRERNAVDLVGRLELHGHTREVVGRVELRGDRLIADVGVNQPSFGIRPYRAALGGLRIKPDVVVRMVIPVAVLGPAPT
jgi:hypothetical protein